MFVNFDTVSSRRELLVLQQLMSSLFLALVTVSSGNSKTHFSLGSIICWKRLRINGEGEGFAFIFVNFILKEVKNDSSFNCLTLDGLLQFLLP